MKHYAKQSSLYHSHSFNAKRFKNYETVLYNEYENNQIKQLYINYTSN